MEEDGGEEARTVPWRGLKGARQGEGAGGNACFLSALAAKRKMEEQLSDSRVDLGITK